MIDKIALDEFRYNKCLEALKFYANHGGNSPARQVLKECGETIDE